MILRFCPVLLLAVLFVASSCQKPLFPDDPTGNPDAKWDTIAYKSERLLLGLHATPFELYAISENQFARFGGENELIEKRPLDTGAGVKGVPVLSDNAFVRLTTDDQAHQIIEFHLTRNPAEIVKIPADSLAGPSDSFLEVEYLTQYKMGAFSSNGNSFLLAARTFPSRKYSLFLFELQYNAAHSAFTAVAPVKRIDLDLSAELTSIINIRFVDGNFYVTSQEGAWRVTPTGQHTKIFQQWMLDIFPQEGKLYATGLNPYDFHESTDNGVNWVRLNKQTDLKYVEVANDSLFTQEAISKQWKMVPTSHLNSRFVALPTNVQPTASIFYGAVFYAGRYYFGMDRKIYFTDKPVLE